MKASLVFVLGLFVAVSRGADLRAPSLVLDKNALSVTVDAKESVTVCTARMSYLASDGALMDTEDSYLLQFDYGSPTILDKIPGFKVSLELRDVNDDGKIELLAFFSAGAHQYGVRVYKIDGRRIFPLFAQPRTSNMHSVKFVNGEIQVETQQRVAVREAIIETSRYRIEGDKLVLVGTTKRTITQ